MADLELFTLEELVAELGKRNLAAVVVVTRLAKENSHETIFEMRYNGDITYCIGLLTRAQNSLLKDANDARVDQNPENGG